MVQLPRTCDYCAAELMHYGSCNCPTATLDWVDTERKAIKERLKRLDAIEREALERKLRELGVLPARKGVEREQRK